MLSRQLTEKRTSFSCLQDWEGYIPLFCAFNEVVSVKFFTIHPKRIACIVRNPRRMQRGRRQAVTRQLDLADCERVLQFGHGPGTGVRSPYGIAFGVRSHRFYNNLLCIPLTVRRSRRIFLLPSLLKRAVLDCSEYKFPSGTSRSGLRLFFFIVLHINLIRFH